MVTKISLALNVGWLFQPLALANPSIVDEFVQQIADLDAQVDGTESVDLTLRGILQSQKLRVFRVAAQPEINEPALLQIEDTLTTGNVEPPNIEPEIFKHLIIKISFEDDGLSVDAQLQSKSTEWGESNLFEGDISEFDGFQYRRFKIRKENRTVWPRNSRI